MKNLIPLMAVALAFAFGCGTKQNKSDSKKEYSEAEKSELEAEYAKIPTAAIVRVPVDANGMVTGEPEMRSHTGKDIASDDAAASAFESGTAVSSLQSDDELDADTSTQSWSRWGGGCGGAGLTMWNGCRFNNNYWQSNYRPRLGWHGRYWNYGLRRPFVGRRFGYRYYCYRPNRYW